ncbi:MAG: hypothetical protein LBH25_05195 [Fibromonadaceae bacterium]|jgi:hypothetical protein|nr:hypothetical protein [Fibromonadaceae bacterium]
MIKKFIFSFLLLLFLCSFVFANYRNERVSIYPLHPASIYFLIANLPEIVLSEGAKEYYGLNSPIGFYFTVEYPLNDLYSLVVNPSIYYEKSIDYNKDYNREDWKFFRMGSGIGIRYFLNGNADGFYLQLMPSAYYTNLIKYHYDKANEITSGPIIDILGYVGYSAKFSRISIFFDAGAGYAWGPFSSNSSGLLKFGSSGYSKRSIDFNFGFGFAL